MEEKIFQLVQLLFKNGFIEASGNVIAALIQASGAIIAAVVAAIFAKNIVKKDIVPHFHTYSNTPHNLVEVICGARHDVFIVVAVGDNLLKEYLGVISELLRRKIHIRYLLLDVNGFLRMEEYMHGEWKKGTQIRNDTLSILSKLASDYNDSFEVRVFSSIMTASYIGVDIQGPILASSIIQEMIYQYRTKASDCPITYISPRNDKIAFQNTVKAITAMWDDSMQLPLSKPKIKASKHNGKKKK